MANPITTADMPIGHFDYSTWTIGAAATAHTIPYGTKEVMWYGSTAVIMGLGPVLKGLFYTTDAGVTYTDYTDYARQGSAGTNEILLNSMNTYANGDWLEAVFSSNNVGGVYVDVHDANSNDVDMDAYYDGGAWIDASVTDGTDSSGTLAQDGVISWTPSSAWRQSERTYTLANSVTKKVQGYAMRFHAAGALDSDTNIYRVIPLVYTTTYTGAYLQASTTYVFPVDPEKTGSIHGIRVSGDSTAMVTFISDKAP